jgi:serine/threonine-protein kinase
MELLEGHDLAKLVELQGRFSVEQAVDYVLEATEAVAEAHVLGMVHRDLKPANLLLARGPGGATTVKVLDFGISKMLDAKREGEQTSAGLLTNEGVALGSPGYMAPEQMSSSRDVDVRADIYSLGAILYRLVSGRNPYEGGSLVSVLASMAIDPLPPLASLVPDVPDGFAQAVERCLAQEPDARFPSVAHFADGFTAFASRRGRDSAVQILATMNVSLEPFGATIVRPVVPSAPAIRRSVPPPLAPAEAPAADRSWMGYAAGGLVAAAVLVGLLVLAVPRSEREDRTGPGPSTGPPTAPLVTAPVATPPAASAPVAGTVIGASPMPQPSATATAPRPTAPVKAAGTRPKPGHPHGPSSAPPSPTDVPGGRR